MTWLQLALIADRENAPLIEAALDSAGALAVTIDDGADDPLPEQILEPAPDSIPLWRRVRITALYDHDPQSAMLAEQAAEKTAPLSLAPPLISTLDDRPWERVWLENLRPTRFGRRLWVCPQGQRPDPTDSGESAETVTIDLDPGLAFGTGNHPTTALCLRWLDGLDLEDRVVVDYGCGSGILAIAALKLGARHVVAVDHDPQALDASVDNALANGVIERLAVTRPESLPSIVADVIVANILAGPLITLAQTLTALAAPTALLGLSGILSHQAPRVAGAYRGAFLIQPPVIEQDWALLSGVRIAR